jgi:hypothetical protein
MKLARRLDDTNSKNPEMRQVLAKLNGIKSEKLRVTPNISAQTILDETRLDQTKVNNKDLSSNKDEIEFLQNITNHWNEIMITQPKIDLLAKTKITKTRISAIKKITKDYPEYKDHEYFEGHFQQLATREEFLWQRDNKQISFDQATNLTKFAGNLDKMKMEATR